MRVAPLAGPASGCQPILRSNAQPAGTMARPHLPSSRPNSDATSSAYCSSLQHSRQTPGRPFTALAAAAATEEATADAIGQLPAAGANVEAAPGNGALLLAEEHEWAPEAFTLAPGEVGPVDRHSESGEPAEAFRCAGCTRPECQGPTGCPAIDWSTPVAAFNDYLRQILRARVYEVAVETPLEDAAQLSAQLGNTVLLKREDMQQVFSFKLRGAYNKMAQLTPEELARGVITSSAGNHAQGVALAARQLGCEALICMPVTTPQIKVDSVRRLGGTVQLHGESYTETQTYAWERARSEGRVFIAPYDDPYTIAGQGTVGQEILRQVHDPAAVSAIFVPVGGGGLIAGIAAYVKAIEPSIKIIGVEPSGANAMAISLARGKRTTLAKVDAFADGVAVKTVGRETFRVCRELLDGVVLVNNAAISGAIRDVYSETRTVLEPAGALAVAGARAYLQRHHMKGETVVAVTSGANMNFDRLRLVSELAQVGARREAMLATTIPEARGAFLDFIETAVGNTAIPITEFKYRFSAGKVAHILFSIGIRDNDEVEELMQRMEKRGYPTRDLSSCEAAQVHLRHLVGGRARSYTGELPDERIFQVEFPERAGALMQFLRILNPVWNISLFHYRQSGNRASTILLGLQLPAADEERFSQAVAALGSDYSFEPLPEDAQSVFEMFIQ